MPIEPLDPNPRSGMHPAAKVGAIATTIAAVSLAVAPFVTTKEGTVLHTYRDGGGVATYCTGETQHVDWKAVYTKGQCADLLKRRLAADYAPQVLKCVPAFIEDRRRKPFMAAIDASYNAGPAGFCRSPMERAFNAGRWAAGCDAFLTWRATINGQPSKGLRNRRAGERLLCMGGI